MRIQSDGAEQYSAIALSVADINDVSSLGDKQALFTKLVRRLIFLIFQSGREVVYGGKLGKDNFSETLKKMVEDYKQDMSFKDAKVLITNYLAWPYYNRMTEDEEENILLSGMRIVKANPSDTVNETLRGKYVTAIDLTSRFLYATSMTEMRKQAENYSKARIFIGGKTAGFSGCMPGIMEEFLVALEYHHPVYLIGGYGGATKIITQIIEKIDGVSSATLREKAMTSSNYISLCEYYANKGMPVDYTVLDGIKIEDLDNGLSVEQNLRLFHSLDIEEIVSLVSLGLKTKNCI